MRCEAHVRFLGGGGAEMCRCYPTIRPNCCLSLARPLLPVASRWATSGVESSPVIGAGIIPNGRFLETRLRALNPILPVILLQTCQSFNQIADSGLIFTRSPPHVAHVQWRHAGVRTRNVSAGRQRIYPHRTPSRMHPYPCHQEIALRRYGCSRHAGCG